MVNFISSESRGQSRFVEDSVQRLQETLNDRRIAKKLGRVSQQLLLLSNDIYVPDVRRGQVTIPDSKLDSDSLPVIAMRPWSKVNLDPKFAVFTPRRRSRAIGLIDNLDPTDIDSSDWLENYQQAILTHAQRTTATRNVRGAEAMRAARASSAPIEPGEFRRVDSGRIHFLPRSLVILRRQRNPISPPVFAHELIHVAQDDSEPVAVSDGGSRDDHILHNELEAYSIGARIALAMSETGQKITEHDEYGIRIEQVRGRVNKKSRDPYKPTPKLKSELRARGLMDDLIDTE